MAGVVAPILQWLNENPELAGLATFVISASESVAIIGTIVPGSVTMTAIGALAGAGVIPLWSTIIWAILGAIVGDGISYWIGHYFKDRLRRMWPFKDNPGILTKGEVFVHKYGVASIFIGRFVGPVRALVPVVAGMLGMKPIQFTIANVTSAIGWAPAYMLPGILLGAASLELPPDIALHVILAFFFIVLFFGLCAWLLYRFIQLIHVQIDQMQNWIWAKLKASPLLAPTTVLLKHHDENREHGQLNLAVYFLIFSFLFVAVAIYIKAFGAPSLTVNQAAYHLFRGIRNPAMDDIMLNITLLGQKQVIIPMIIAIVGSLLYYRNYRAATHAFLLAVFAGGGVFVIKKLLHSMRPEGIFNTAETFSMPSGHTTISVAIYLGLAFLIAHSLKQKSLRWLTYIIALLIPAAVGLSRMYLGAHWFTDVFSSWLLGTSIICFVIISYERYLSPTIQPVKILLPAIAALVLSFGYYHSTHYDTMRTNYAQVDWPVVSVQMDEWWDHQNVIPDARSSLFGFPSQPINIQWVGSLEDIKNTLLQEGWSRPPARDWVSTLHRVADISSTQYLPMISPQYLDKKPELILTKNMAGVKNLLVVRFWASNRLVAGNNEPLWVGIISIVPRTYSWVFKKRDAPLEINPDLIFSNLSMQRWDYKIVTATLTSSQNKIRLQPVILIRPH
jgi:membrane protein DedA with SNARE-associated domain/membrane-associated phospholipid phosphatase